MKFPKLNANIERRLLVNYSVDPVVLQPLLPSGYTPQLVNGRAVAGICLIRMGAVRPPRLKPEVGWRGENVAHRIAVERQVGDTTQHGVFIPIRHSASVLPVLAGGRLFPGVHKHADFVVHETDERIAVQAESSDYSVDVKVRVTDEWTGELFPDLEAASQFFKKDKEGWSPQRHGDGMDTMVLETDAWSVEVGSMETLKSSFFDSLPAGSYEFDNVLVMRKVPVTWGAP